MAKKVLVIGAGMSGALVSILLAKQGHKVTLFERNNKVGKKVLVTGNGRCNITNEKASMEHYHSMTNNIFNHVFKQFGLAETEEIFRDMGLDFVKGEDGKLYPRSLQASSVVQTLLLELDHKNIQLIYDARIKQVHHDKKYKIVCHDKNYYGDYLVIATGGRSYQDSGSSGDGYDLARKLGHTVTDLYPSIVQLKTDYAYNKALKGLKVNVHGRLMKDGDTVRADEGEVLFTDYGISGPVILQLSTKVEPGLSSGESYELALDFIPEMTVDELDTYLMQRFQRLSHRSVEASLIGMFNQRLMVPMLKGAGIGQDKKASDVTKEERKRLVKQLKGLRIKVSDTYLWNQAQVTKGGVDCNEIHPDTLESKTTERLYFVGEVLDIDGDCGGYNLQWAISSAAVCAMAINRN